MSLIRQATESLIYTSCRSEGWRKCVEAWEMLHYPLEKRERVSDFSVSSENPLCSLVTEIPEAIWNSLPLQDHEITLPSEETLEFLDQAFLYLDAYQAEIWSDAKSFLQALVFLALKDPTSVRITSASLPDLPFCSFISSKALHHIPPQTLSPEWRISFLAENLYHESVHHRVSLNLLENPILVEDYHAGRSPQISIPWRQNNSSRTRSWEIDRIIHAFSVYVALLPYRSKQAQLHPHSEWGSYLQECVSCAIFLGETLNKHTSFLTSLGKEYLREERKKISFYVPEQYTTKTWQVSQSG